METPADAYSAIYPQIRQLSLTVRIFLDWIAQLISESALLSDMDVNVERRLPTGAVDPGVTSPFVVESGKVVEDTGG